MISVSQASTKNSRMPWNTLVRSSRRPSSAICALSPPMIGQRQEQAGDQDAERIEPAEKGDDDGGEAVARRDAGLEMTDRPGTSMMPARPASAPEIRKVNSTRRLVAEAGEARRRAARADHA